MSNNILLIGFGGIGRALQKVLAKRNDIIVFDADEKKMPCPITLSNALRQSDIAIICAPAAANRAIAQSIARTDTIVKFVFSVSKGLEPNTGKLVPQVLREELDKKIGIGLIMGPMVAENLMQGKRTRAVVASKSPATISAAQAIFAGSIVELVPSDDIDGAAICSVLKNIYAIGAGVVAQTAGGDIKKRDDYLKLALAEMKEVAVVLGAEPQTIDSPAGRDDFLATARSPHSSNFKCGRLIARGQKPIPCEGIGALDGIIKKLNTAQQKFPILGTIKAIIDGRENVNRIHQTISPE